MKKTKVDILRIISQKTTGKPNKGRTVVEVLQGLVDDYPSGGAKPPDVPEKPETAYLVTESGEQIVTEAGETLILEKI